MKRELLTKGEARQLVKLLRAIGRRTITVLRRRGGWIVLGLLASCNMVDAKGGRSYTLTYSTRTAHVKTNPSLKAKTPHHAKNAGSKIFP